MGIDGAYIGVGGLPQFCGGLRRGRRFILEVYCG